MSLSILMFKYSLNLTLNFRWKSSAVKLARSVLKAPC